MSRRTLVLLAASAIAGVTLAASVSTDASAARKHARAVAVAPTVVVVTDSGPPADRVPRCFDSPILYPVPPCY